MDSEIESYFDSLREMDSDKHQERMFGYVYSLGEEHDNEMKRIAEKFTHTTGLDHKAFPSSALLEREVIGWTLSLFNSPEGSIGSITSGGTESILLALKAVRDKNRKTRPQGNVLIPVTAHPAFVKSCLFLRMPYKIIQVDEEYRVCPGLMESQIDEDTIAIVGSAPNYGVGTVDPLREMGKLAINYDIDFIVDGCLGGMILPFLDDTYDLSFSTPGISIITVDYHKYGYSLKGCSAVLYKDREMLNYQTFTLSSWIGYSIVNTGVQNTKSVSSLASMLYNIKKLGRDGYVDIVNRVMDESVTLRELIKHHIPELNLVGNPHLNIHSITSDSVDIFKLAEEVKRRGWFIQGQLGYHNIKQSFHLSVGYQNLGQSSGLIKILKDSIQTIGLGIDNAHHNYLDIKSRDRELRKNLINNLSPNLTS